MGLGVWHSTTPLLEVVRVEYEVADAPEQQRRCLLEVFEPHLGLAHDVVPGIGGPKRDVLDETVHREPVVPRVVGSEVCILLAFRETPLRGAIPECAATEQVEPAHQECAQYRPRQQQGKRHPFARGQVECRRVEDDQPLDPLGVPRGPGHADHASPVVYDERDLSVQRHGLEQEFEVFQAALESVGISVLSRLVRESAAYVVGYDHPVAAA